VESKGGPSQKIPLNDQARQLLSSHSKTKSPYVFPGRGGKQRISAQAGVNKIKKAAGLPKDFRPLHGLRHTYASMLASSGKVDMYTLQRLLTHKSPIMTQRYAHLRDEALKRASGLAGDIITEAANRIIADKNGVVSLKDRKK
jgi:integrase